MLRDRTPRPGPRTSLKLEKEGLDDLSGVAPPRRRPVLPWRPILQCKTIPRIKQNHGPGLQAVRQRRLSRPRVLSSTMAAGVDATLGLVMHTVYATDNGLT
jgi:hypothetical protein